MLSNAWVRGLLVAATLVLAVLKLADVIAVSWVAAVAPALIAAVATGSG